MVLLNGIPINILTSAVIRPHNQNSLMPKEHIGMVVGHVVNTQIAQGILPLVAHI